MRTYRYPLAGVVAAVALSFAYSDEAAAQYYRDQLRPRPSVMEYDLKTDKFVHAESLLYPGDQQRLSDTAFYGNRLQQFRYLGPSKNAGLYRVLDWHTEKYGYDPREYRYRYYR